MYDLKGVFSVAKVTIMSSRRFLTRSKYKKTSIGKKAARGKMNKHKEEPTNHIEVKVNEIQTYRWWAVFHHWIPCTGYQPSGVLYGNDDCGFLSYVVSSIHSLVSGLNHCGEQSPLQDLLLLVQNFSRKNHSTSR